MFSRPYAQAQEELTNPPLRARESSGMLSEFPSSKVYFIPFTMGGIGRTFDQSSISISPAVVSRITLPFVGRAMPQSVLWSQKSSAWNRYVRLVPWQIFSKGSRQQRCCDHKLRKASRPGRRARSHSHMVVFSRARAGATVAQSHL